MKRLASIVVATAVAAAVAATLTMPAGADESATAEAKFVGCLRAQGLDIPAATRGDAIKAWILGQTAEAPVRRAVVKCKSEQPSGPGPEALLDCLRDHGLNPPATVDQLKPWLATRFDDRDAEDALRACDVRPPDKMGHDKPAGPCGDKPDAPRPAKREAPAA